MEWGTFFLAVKDGFSPAERSGTGLRDWPFTGTRGRAPIPKSVQNTYEYKIDDRGGSFALEKKRHFEIEGWAPRIAGDGR